MSAPEERLQEIMLEEVLGGVQAPDLEHRILDRRARSRPRRIVSLGIAAALLIALGLYLWPRGASAPPAREQLRCAAGMRVWGEGLDGVRREELRPGHVGRVGAGHTAQWTGGGSFAVHAPTLFAGGEGDELQLWLGSATATGAGRVLRLAEGALELGAGGSAEVSAFFYVPAAANEIAERLLGARASVLVPDVLLVRVVSGAARFEAGAGSLRVASGRTLRKLRGAAAELLRDGPEDAFSLSASWARRITGEEEQREAATVEMLAHLQRWPSHWEFVRGWLVDGSGANADPRLRRHLLTILAQDPALGMQKLVLSRLDSVAAKNRDGLMLQLAENGNAVARAELARRMGEGDGEGTLRMPAAYSALRGDARGRAGLARFVRGAVLLDFDADTFAACAYALRELGEEQPWRRVVSWSRQQALEALAAGRPEEARRHVLRVEYFVVPAREGRRPRFGELSRSLSIHAAQRAGEMLRPPEIRLRLDSWPR